MAAPSSSHSPFSGTGSTSRKSAATTAPAGLDVRAFAADRFSACACGWPCLGSCNGSLWLRSSLFGVRLLSPLFFRPRNGCFLLPSVAFALRRPSRGGRLPLGVGVRGQCGQKEEQGNLSEAHFMVERNSGELQSMSFKNYFSLCMDTAAHPPWSW